ncbi:MAG: FAD-dependent oxidoreductase [bacterium]|nr:FAD-dependent oxidoreductase [bacterium]
MLEEITLRLVGTRHEYGDVRTFIFRPEGPVMYEAGQYIHLRLPAQAGVPGVKEGESVREFSFASAPSDAEIWFSMHVRPESAYKMRLAELTPGDEVTIFKIKGDFTYPRDETREAVFIAGGVGMTPFRSMVRQREALGLSPPAVLVHVASDGYLFQDEMQTKPIEQYRITRSAVDATLRAIALRKSKALYYIAGSPFFTVTTSTILEKLGIPMEQIKRDDFDGYEGEA